MDSPGILKQVQGLELHLGGEAHRGWFPPGAAEPLPTPERLAVLDVRIEDDGFGYLLICESRNTADSWDTWHETREAAERQAEEVLGIRAGDWEGLGAA